MDQYTTQAQPAAPHRLGALAWTTLILGIVGIVGSPFFILNNLTAVIAAVGFILGIIALFGTRKILAALGTVLCVAAVAFTVMAQGAATEELTGSSTGRSTGGSTDTRLVTYQAESSTGTVDISYGSSNSSVTETGRPSPWTLDVQASNFGFFSVTLPYDSYEGSVTCRIFKAGEVVTEQTATGQYASVSCFTP